jgi:hypothetical protein
MEQDATKQPTENKTEQLKNEIVIPSNDFGPMHALIIIGLLGAFSCFLPIASSSDSTEQGKIPTIFSMNSNMPLALLVPASFIATAGIAYGLLRQTLKPRTPMFVLAAMLNSLSMSVAGTLWALLNQLSILTLSNVSAGTGVILPTLLALAGAAINYKIVLENKK